MSSASMAADFKDRLKGRVVHSIVQEWIFQKLLPSYEDVPCGKSDEDELVIEKNGRQGM